MNPRIRPYKNQLHLSEAHFVHIDHEDAMVATVFKITQPDGEQLILKVCSRTEDYLREAYFLHHFAGKLPVPRIIQLVQPEMGMHGAILMEYLPGKLLKTADLNSKLTRKQLLPKGRSFTVCQGQQYAGGLLRQLTYRQIGQASVNFDLHSSRCAGGYHS